MQRTTTNAPNHALQRTATPVTVHAPSRRSHPRRVSAWPAPGSAVAELGVVSRHFTRFSNRSMIQWVLDHYQTILGWAGTTGVAIWAWFSAHHGQLRKAFRAIRQLLYLRSELRVTTEQLAVACTEATEAQALAKQLAAENDKLTKLLQPPIRRDELEEDLLIIAGRNRYVRWNTLQDSRGEHRVTSQFRLQQLLDAGLLERARENSSACYLTHAGRAYLVQHGLVPQPEPKPSPQD